MSAALQDSGQPREEALAAAEAARRLGPADLLVSRVLDIAAARSLALDALLSVASIDWNADVATACVECAVRPRLLLNPLFVEARCGTRERLAFLLLHELSHISLGHTRLYPRPTPLHNIAFDAVINASLLASLVRHEVEVESWSALLEDCYGAGESHLFLLRPPPGWPRRPDWKASAECDEPLREIHRRLYAPARRRAACGVTEVTYTEILGALARSVSAGGEDGDGGLPGEGLLARLLGAHGTSELERSAMSSGRDAVAAEVLERPLAALGLDGKPGSGPGGEPYLIAVERRRSERALERALAALLRRVFVESREGITRLLEESSPSVSPDPSRDRRAAARRAAARMLGAPAPLLFRSEVVRTRPERKAAVIYLDVSGSMSGLLERLHAALVPLRRLLAPEVLVFSTEVVPVSRAAFVAGRLPSTGGTSVEPVLRHLCSLPALAPRRGQAGRRALVLTDGYFVEPSAAAQQVLRLAGHEIHLGVLGPGPLHDLSPWVAGTTRLPDPITSHTQMR
jgi:hypothetical protein